MACAVHTREGLAPGRRLTALQRAANRDGIAKVRRVLERSAHRAD